MQKKKYLLKTLQLKLLTINIPVFCLLVRYYEIFYCCSSKACARHLLESKQKGKNPHILNISPPLSMKPIWFKNHTAYTIAKYGMSMCVLGMAAEFEEQGLAVNALWPKTGM